MGGPQGFCGRASTDQGVCVCLALHVECGQHCQSSFCGNTSEMKWVRGGEQGAARTERGARNKEVVGGAMHWQAQELRP